MISPPIPSCIPHSELNSPTPSCVPHSEPYRPGGRWTCYLRPSRSPDAPPYRVEESLHHHLDHVDPERDVVRGAYPCTDPCHARRLSNISTRNHTLFHLPVSYPVTSRGRRGGCFGDRRMTESNRVDGPDPDPASSHVLIGIVCGDMVRHSNVHMRKSNLQLRQMAQGERKLTCRPCLSVESLRSARDWLAVLVPSKML